MNVTLSTFRGVRVLIEDTGPTCDGSARTANVYTIGPRGPRRNGWVARVKDGAITASIATRFIWPPPAMPA